MKQLLGLVVFASVLTTVAVPVAAASPGIAYDSVTKFAIGGGTASTQPGTYDADFQTASQPAQPQPVAPRSAGPPAPQAVATDDGSKVAMNVTNEALGQKQIGSDLADGFRSNITMTITRPSSQTVTTQMMTTEYVINFPDTTLTCGGVASGLAGPSAAALQQYATMQRAMAENNSRFTVTSSGPTPPHGRYSLFTVVTMGGSGGGPPSGSPPGGFASIIERGHERVIQSDDPIFSVPPDFAKTSQTNE